MLPSKLVDVLVGTLPGLQTAVVGLGGLVVSQAGDAMVGLDLFVHGLLKSKDAFACDFIHTRQNVRGQ